MIDPLALAKLSPNERQVLILLAQGHTTKSIASLLGLSTGAVNERLREARRKTGAASSRELARALAQENRDENIGVATPAIVAEPAVGRSSRSPHRRTAVMIIAVTTVAIAAGLLAIPDAPRQDAMTTPADQLHTRLLAEKRDARWADDAETTLQAIYAPFPGVGEVTVACATRLCEVSGDLTDPAQAGEALRSPGLVTSVRAAGFAPASSFETAVASANGPTRFRVFWTRG